MSPYQLDARNNKLNSYFTQKEFLLKMMRESIPSDPRSPSQIARAYAIPQPSVRRLLAEMVRDGTVVKSLYGVKNRYRAVI